MSERDDIAKAFHNIYLIMAKALGWLVRSKDAQELDYALADFHLAEIARLREENERLDHLAGERKQLWRQKCTEAAALESRLAQAHDEIRKLAEVHMFCDGLIGEQKDRLAQVREILQRGGDPFLALRTLKELK